MRSTPAPCSWFINPEDEVALRLLPFLPGDVLFQVLFCVMRPFRSRLLVVVVVVALLVLVLWTQPRPFNLSKTCTSAQSFIARIPTTQAKRK